MKKVLFVMCALAFALTTIACEPASLQADNQSVEPDKPLRPIVVDKPIYRNGDVDE